MNEIRPPAQSVQKAAAPTAGAPNHQHAGDSGR